MVQRMFKLRRGDVQRSGQRCEEDKRTDKQPDIEMEATQQVSHAARGVQVVILFLLRQKVSDFVLKGESRPTRRRAGIGVKPGKSASG